jgi:hypothetical protein
MGCVKEGQTMFPGKKAVIIDAEHDLNIPWVQKLGVDPDRLIVVYPEFAEQVVDMAESLLYAEDVFLVGWTPLPRSPSSPRWRTTHPRPATAALPSSWAA